MAKNCCSAIMSIIVLAFFSSTLWCAHFEDFEAQLSLLKKLIEEKDSPKSTTAFKMAASKPDSTLLRCAKINIIQFYESKFQLEEIDNDRINYKFIGANNPQHSKGVFEFNVDEQEGNYPSIICKIFLKRKLWIEASKNLRRSNEFYAKFKEHENFPYIAHCHDFVPAVIIGNEINLDALYAVYLDKAEGKTLSAWMIDFIFNEQNFSDEIDIVELTNAGRQLACFHKVTAEFIPPSMKATLHHDLHMANIIYDISTRKLALIDTDTLGKLIDHKEDVIKDLLLLFYWQPENCRQKLRSLSYINDKSYEIFNKRIEIFLQALKNGYLLTFKDADFDPAAINYLEEAIDYFINPSAIKHLK